MNEHQKLISEIESMEVDRVEDVGELDEKYGDGIVVAPCGKSRVLPGLTANTDRRSAAFRQILGFKSRL